MPRFNNNFQNSDKKYEERILTIRRVSKKTTGGNYISFSAVVVIGDGKGNVGLGIGRGLEVPPAIQKAITQAKKNLIFLPAFNETIPHQIQIKYKASRILLKPAPPGTGLKVGGVVRVILDLAGVNNASGKIIGSRNKITNAYAVMEAIKRLKPRIVSEKKQAVKKEEVAEAASVKDSVEPKEEKVVKEVKETKVESVVEKAEVKKITKAASVKDSKDSGEPKKEKKVAVKKSAKKAEKKV